MSDSGASRWRIGERTVHPDEVPQLADDSPQVFAQNWLTAVQDGESLLAWQLCDENLRRCIAQLWVSTVSDRPSDVVGSVERLATVVASSAEWAAFTPWWDMHLSTVRKDTAVWGVSTRVRFLAPSLFAILFIPTGPLIQRIDEPQAADVFYVVVTGSSGSWRIAGTGAPSPPVPGYPPLFPGWLRSHPGGPNLYVMPIRPLIALVRTPALPTSPRWPLLQDRVREAVNEAFSTFEHVDEGPFVMELPSQQLWERTDMQHVRPHTDLRWVRPGAAPIREVLVELQAFSALDNYVRSEPSLADRFDTPAGSTSYRRRRPDIIEAIRRIFLEPLALAACEFRVHEASWLSLYGAFERAIAAVSRPQLTWVPMPGLLVAEGDLVIDNDHSLHVMSDRQLDAVIQTAAIPAPADVEGQLSVPVNHQFGLLRRRNVSLHLGDAAKDLLPEDADDPAVRTLATRWAQAIRLVLGMAVGVGGTYTLDIVDVLDEPASAVASLPQEVGGPRLSTGVVCASDVAEIRAVAEALSGNTVIADAPLQEALRRVLTAGLRDHWIDSLTDLVVALEALLGHGERGEITYKLALRTGALLGRGRGTFSGRGRVVRAFVTKVYGLRSKVLHGDMVKPAGKRRLDGALAESEWDIVADLDAICRAAVREAVMAIHAGHSATERYQDGAIDEFIDGEAGD